MKTTIKRIGQAGNALLVCMVATGIVGIILASYLTLVKSQTQSVARSQTWNTTVSLIEAGMEEAMAHLNLHGSSNLLCESNWQLIGTKYVTERSLGDGYYVVSIDNWIPGTNCTPVIESRGFVTPPVLVSSLSMPGPFVAAQTLDVNALTPSGKLGRGVRATATVDALFSKGLVAKGQIDMNGNNIMTDSFDSLDANYSSSGSYDPSKAKANGDVATDLTIVNSVNIGNANIHGSVSTGPKGSVNVGPQGVVTGKVTDDMNVAFPAVVVPFASGPYFNSPGFSGSTNLNGVTYAQIYDTGNYKIDGWDLSNPNRNILIRGEVAVWLRNGFSMQNSSVILAPGAKLTLYMGGPGSIGGNAGFNNDGDATKLMVYGLPGCTSLSFGGNASFTGCLYAPSAAFSMNGGGNNATYDFRGASITASVTMNGHFNFHYDEALRKRGPIRGFVMTSWNEMAPGEVANVPTRSLAN